MPATPAADAASEAADDWVAQEVGTALAKGVPVYPVLIEDTPMPRSAELPQALQPLLRFNAISISDRRWDVDTTRLAKIVSLDIPSFKERRLRAVNLVACTALVLSIAFLVFIVLSIVATLLFTNLRHIDGSRRNFFRAAAWVAAVGTLGTFILYFVVCPEYEAIVNFYMAMLIAPVVLTLMCLSGFRAK